MVRVLAEAIAPLDVIVRRFDSLVAAYVEWLDLAEEDRQSGPLDPTLTAGALAVVRACEAQLGDDMQGRAYWEAVAARAQGRGHDQETAVGAMATPRPLSA
jgi:hypothetical protein